MMLDEMNILVVGGSGDIGLALCRELVGKGATVAATYFRNPEGLRALQTEFPDRLEELELDVTSQKSCESLGDTLEKRGTIPRVLVYNAGVVQDCPVLGMTDERWRDVMDVNLTGALNVFRAVVKFMSMERGGKIFLVSSVAGAKGGRGQANYAASKAGLEALGRSLAVELARKQILVNMVAPGVIESRMSEGVVGRAHDEVLGRITLGRLGKPEEVARFIAHLCSDEITYVTGQTFYIDGGFKL